MAQREVVCPSCNGTGRVLQGSPHHCGQCWGKRTITENYVSEAERRTARDVEEAQAKKKREERAASERRKAEKNASRQKSKPQASVTKSDGIDGLIAFAGALLFGYIAFAQLEMDPIGGLVCAAIGAGLAYALREVVKGFVVLGAIAGIIYVMYTASQA